LAITIDTSALNRVMRDLKGFEKQVPKAVQQAINRTIKHAETRSAQAVIKDYNIKSGEVKKTMKTRYANVGSLKAHVKVDGKRLTLARFLPGGLNSSSKVAKVKIKKGASYKRVGGEPKAFVQSVTGRTHIMRREGRSRYPVDVMRTIATGQMVSNEDVSKVIQKDVNAMLEKTINHEISRRLNKLAGKK